VAADLLLKRDDDKRVIEPAGPVLFWLLWIGDPAEVKVKRAGRRSNAKMPDSYSGCGKTTFRKFGAGSGESGWRVHRAAMKSNPEQTGEQNERPGSRLALTLLAPVVGTMSGLLGVIFRFSPSASGSGIPEVEAVLKGQRFP